MVKNRFFRAHAAPVLLYFFAALFFTVLRVHPVFCPLSLCAAVLMRVYAVGPRVLRSALPTVFFAVLLLTVLNPLVNTGGLTVLFSVFGHAVTAEALLYGFSSGCMLAAVTQWFLLMRDTAAFEKITELLSGTAPTVSTAVVMLLRVVPRLLRTAEETEQVRLALCGARTGRGGALKYAMRTSTVVLEKSLTDSIETAKSMNARGFGSGKRRRTRAPMGRADRRFFAAVLLLFAAVALLTALGGKMRFYPSVRMPRYTLPTVLSAAALLLLPLGIDGKDAILCLLSEWKTSRSPMRERGKRR